MLDMFSRLSRFLTRRPDFEMPVAPQYDAEPDIADQEIVWSNDESSASNVEPVYSNAEPVYSKVEPAYSNAEPAGFTVAVEPPPSKVEEPVYLSLTDEELIARYPQPEPFDDDPSILAMIEEKRASRPDPKAFTFIENALKPALDAYHGKDTATEIENLQRIYSTAVAQTRSYMSKENEVPGFRRLAIFAMADDRWHVVAIRDNGVPYFAKLVSEGVTYISRSACLESMREASYEGDDPSKLREAKYEHDRLVNSDRWRPWLEKFHPAYPMDDLIKAAAGQDVKGLFLVHYGPSSFTFNLRSPSFSSWVETLNNPRREAFSDLPKAIRGKAVALAVKSRSDTVKTMMHVMFKSLDPDVQKIMRSTLQMRLDAAQWLMGVNIHSSGRLRFMETYAGHDNPNADLALVRQQAVRSFPLFIREMMKDYVKSDIAVAVDRKAPLIPAIADQLRITERMAKLFVGLTWQKSCVSPSSKNLENLRQNLDLLTVNPDHMPKNRAEFSAFKAFTRYIGPLRSADRSLLTQKANGDWMKATSFLSRVPSNYVFDHILDMSERLFKAAIVLHSKETVFVEGDATRNGRPDFRRAFYNVGNDFIADIKHSTNIRDLVEGSERWHRALAQISQDLSYAEHMDDQAGRWGPFIGQLDLGGDIVAREINSGVSMRLQGKRENHCVGGYVNKVTQPNVQKDGLCLILSLEREGRCLSTVELNISLKEKITKEGEKIQSLSCRVVQNYAKGNTTPEKEAFSAVKSLCKKIEAMGPEAVAPYVNGLKEWSKNSDAITKDFIQEKLDANLADPEYLEKAWKIYAPLLPKAMRKGGLEGFIERAVKSYDVALERRASVSRDWEDDYDY